MNKIYIVSHPRSGLHLLKEICRKNFKNYLFDQKKDHLTHCRITNEKINKNVIYLVRDGRDAVLSGYISVTKKCGPGKRCWTNYSSNCHVSFSEYLNEKFRMILDNKNNVIKSVNPIIFWVLYNEEWMNDSNIIATVKYEDLIDSQEIIIKKLQNVFGYNKKPCIVNEDMDLRKSVINKNLPKNFKRMRYGNWKNYFSKEDLKLFELIAGKTMKKLGYDL